jgi:hypothetical protein
LAQSRQTGPLTDQQTAKPENKKLSKIRAVTDVTRILLIAATRARVSALTPEPDTSVTANKIRGSHLEKTLHLLGTVDIQKSSTGRCRVCRRYSVVLPDRDKLHPMRM